MKNIYKAFEKNFNLINTYIMVNFLNLYNFNNLLWDL